MNEPRDSIFFRQVFPITEKRRKDREASSSRSRTTMKSKFFLNFPSHVSADVTVDAYEQSLKNQPV